MLGPVYNRFVGSLSGTLTCTLRRWIGLSSLLRQSARTGMEGRRLSRTDLISCPCLQSAAQTFPMPPLCLPPNCAARLQYARSVSRSGAGGLRGGAVMRFGAVRGWLAMAMCRTPARSVWVSVARAPSRQYQRLSRHRGVVSHRGERLHIHPGRPARVAWRGSDFRAVGYAAFLKICFWSSRWRRRPKTTSPSGGWVSSRRSLVSTRFASASLLV